MPNFWAINVPTEEAQAHSMCQLAFTENGASKVTVLGLGSWRGWSGARVEVGMLRGRGFLGILASWFSVS